MAVEHCTRKGKIVGRFDNRTVIVTGGSRGMGSSHVRGFVAEGANVVIADVLEQEGRTVAGELGDHAIFSRLDVTSDRDWAATVAAAEDAFGPVSVLVNNAGIVRFGPIAETEPAAWRQVIDINLTGTYLGIRAIRSEEHTSELQSHSDLVCRLLLEKKKNNIVGTVVKEL